MLKEKIMYRDELPINVITANIEEYPIHFHDDMEVVYVLDGSITLRNGYYTYNLKHRTLPPLYKHSFLRGQPATAEPACTVRKRFPAPA